MYSYRFNVAKAHGVTPGSTKLPLYLHLFHVDLDTLAAERVREVHSELRDKFPAPHYQVTATRQAQVDREQIETIPA